MDPPCADDRYREEGGRSLLLGRDETMRQELGGLTVSYLSAGNQYGEYWVSYS